MRKIKLMGLCYIFWILLVNVSGQSDYDETSYYPTDGEDEIKSDLNVSRDLIRLAGEVSPQVLNLVGKDKIKTSLWSKMNRVQRLTDHANLKLHYMVNKEKVEMQNHYRRVAQLRKNDQLVARAWERSPTGKRDGRYWHQLSVGEKEVCRMRYIQYHNPELFEQPDEPDLVIPESEYEMAWEIRNYNRPGVPDWKEVRNFQTKNNFRKSYYSHKLTKLSPKMQISEEELAEAWEIAQLGSPNMVRWIDIEDNRVREKFRSSYVSLLQKNPLLYPVYAQKENKMVALAHLGSGQK